MTNIIDIRHRFAEPLCKAMITDELVDTLYDFAPIGVSVWNLKIAKVKFNGRLMTDEQSWLDLLNVYVGVPDYVVSVDQLKDEELPYLKVPLGLLEDIAYYGGPDLRVAVPDGRVSELTGKGYDAFYHTNSTQFTRCYYLLDADIRKNGIEFEGDLDGLLSAPVEHVLELKGLVLDRLKEKDWHHARQGALTTALATCMALAVGDKEMIEEFLMIEDAGDIGPEEARRIYANLDIEEFFEWRADHFGLDDYYTDPEAVFDDLKWELEHNKNVLEYDVHYNFLAAIVARSDRLSEKNEVL